MTNTPTLLQISEPVFCVLLISWTAMVLLAFAAGCCMGRLHEAQDAARRKISKP